MATRAPLRPLAVLLVLAAMACRGEGVDETAERMAAEHENDRPVPAAAGAVGGGADVVTESVVYATIDGRPVEGYFARPAEGGTGLPGIVVIHEWWGLNDNIRQMTEALAGEGYQALAVDLYEGAVAEEPERARELSAAAREREAAIEEHLRQAVRYLAETRGAPRIGTIGWCFGGGWSLRTALLLPDAIDATVIYYGRLVTDEETLARLETPILGIFGGRDEAIPVETVRAFEAALRRLGKEAAIHIYEDADHAFANPSGTRYRPDDAADAWEKTLRFFERHLKESGTTDGP